MLGELPRPTGDDALLVCNPDNPTGRVLDLALLEQAARDHLVVVDEAYGEFATEHSGIHPVRRGTGNMLVVRTFSKAFGAAGLRLGYAVGHPDLLRELQHHQLAFPLSSYALVVGSALWRRRAQMTENVRRLQAERAQIGAAFAAMGFQVLPGCANFFSCFPPEGTDPVALGRLMMERGVLVRWFGPGQRHPGFLRVTVGTPGENRLLLQVVRDALFPGATHA
ncbi:MAG: aminotransferase class I/II-fold pyridoxal phosphate-dependent enzyme [Pseudomonadota bacterium]